MEPGTQLSLLDLNTHTYLANAYYKIRQFGLTLNAKYGRFLAGDIGWRFQLSREYENGLEIGAWYSFTDTDDFTYPNKGYNDKGVFMRVPARMFSNYESNTKYRYAFSPWTRDVAQTVGHWRTLFDLGKDLMPAEFAQNIEKIKK